MRARKTTASTPTPRKRLKKGCPFIEFEAKEAKRGDEDEDEEEDENESEHDVSGDSSQEGDDDNESRANRFQHVHPRTPDDLLAQITKLADRMPLEFRKKFDALFEPAKVEPATPIDLDGETPHETAVPRLPPGAVRLSEYIEVGTSGKDHNCAIYTLIEYLGRLIRKPFTKSAAVLRTELFEWLRTNPDVALVGRMTWRLWAASMGQTVEELIAVESSQLGLSNIAYAALANMHGFSMNLYVPCSDDPKYITLVQASEHPSALGTFSSILRNYHYTLALHKEDDAALLDQGKQLVQEPSPAREARVSHTAIVHTPTRHPMQPRSLDLSPVGSCDTPRLPTPNATVATIFGNPVLLSKSAFDYVTEKQTPTKWTFGQPQPVAITSPNRIEFRVPVVGPGDKLKNAVGFVALYQADYGRRSSTTGGTTPVDTNNHYTQKVSLLTGVSSELEEKCDELDEIAAEYIFQYPFHPARQPKLYNVVQTLKARSDNNSRTFKSRLYDLDGTYHTKEGPSRLQLTHPLITKGKPTVVNADPTLRGLNTAYDFTLNGHDRTFSFPHAERHNPTDGLTRLTAANTATFTRFEGLDNGRPLFAVISFEGVMSVSNEDKLYFKVAAHLLRFVLLDVDGTMPILSTPSRDASNNHAIDDFDD